MLDEQHLDHAVVEVVKVGEELDDISLKDEVVGPDLVRAIALAEYDVSHDV